MSNGAVTAISPENEQLLKVVQTDFPVTERPFAKLAEIIGQSEKDIMASMKHLIESRIIRTFGPVFDARKLGYVSTLVAAKVESDSFDELSTLLNETREITHNYLRENELNIWFTITARNDERLRQIINTVNDMPGVLKTFDLPVMKLFKISAVFGADKSDNSQKMFTGDSVSEPSEQEQGLIRILQSDFPIVDRPYEVLAEKAGLSEAHVIKTIGEWTLDGTIRRFGARLDHRKAGYKTNTLVAWQGEDVVQWGETFSTMTQVSHCYLRKSHPEWPYELYTMIHAKDDIEMSKTLQAMEIIALGSKVMRLKTMKELKKTSMKYFMENQT